MFLRDEAHKSYPTECSPVHVVSPSPVSWVPEVHPSSEKTPPHHAHGDMSSLAPHERLPAKRPASRLERRAESLATPRDEA